MLVLRLLLRIPLALLALVAVVAAGVGWLYALRHVAVLDVGPHVREALPLDRLAHRDAQPLGSLLVAWLPVGVVAGLALRALLPIPRVARALVAGAVGLGLLLLAGAASDAITESERVSAFLGMQPHRLAPWLGAGLIAVGALIVPLPAWRPATARVAGATRWRSRRVGAL